MSITIYRHSLCNLFITILLLVLNHYSSFSSPITLNKNRFYGSKLSPILSKPELFSPFLNKQVSLSNIIDDKIAKIEKKTTLLIFLTHLGDLSSFELVQQIVYYIPQLNEGFFYIIIIKLIIIIN